MRKNKSKFTFLAVLLLMSASIACNTLSQQQQLVVVTTTPIGTISGQPDGKIGDQIDREALNFTIISIEEANLYDDIKPETGNKYVAIEIEIESRIDNYELNPLDARLQDSNGKVYFLIFSGKEPFLGTQHGLSKGTKVKGWVTYEVPKTAKGLWLIYEPVFSTPSKTIIVSLEK